MNLKKNILNKKLKTSFQQDLMTSLSLNCPPVAKTRNFMSKLTELTVGKIKLTASSSLSTLLVWDSLTFPVPSSPVAENLTPSLAQEIMTASPIWDRSRQMRANSPEGIFTTQLYSCSYRDTEHSRLATEQVSIRS